MNPLLMVALALFTQVGMGWLYVGRTPRRAVLERLALAHLVGAAAIGLTVTLSLVATDRLDSAVRLIPVYVLGFVGLVRKRVIAYYGTPTEPAAPSREEWRGWDGLLVALVAIGIVTAAARVLLLPLDWDGWAFWQFKARALLDGSLRRLLTSPEFGFGHPDYPLLNPANTWWLCAGGFHPKLAQLSGFLFFLDAVILTHAAIRRLASQRWALIGCVVLGSWPLVMKHAASGFSDLALAAYALATATLLSEGDLPVALPCLAGALLTKNEGLFTFGGAALVGFSLVWLPAPRGTRTHRWLPLAGVVATGIVAAGAWTIMKRRWALHADLLDPDQWPKDLLGSMARRLPGVALGFLREWLSVGPKYPGWGLFWPAAAVGVGLSLRRRLGRTLPYWLMAGTHLAGTLVAYLITPLDPALHLSRSLDRLLLHIAPTVLTATMAALASLDETAVSIPEPNEGPGDTRG